MTGNVLPKNDIAVGTLFVGYGVTDQWTIGTSPFALLTYKMHNWGSRYAIDLSEDDRIIVAVEYFKTYGKENERSRQWREICESDTLYGEEYYENYCRGTQYPYGFSDFQMEAWAYKLNYSLQMASDYRLNVNGSYYYYLDDERPFSLRMDPQNDDKYAVNLTTLHEFRINQKTYFNLEAGFWGMNYTYPYFHFGTSVGFQPSKASLLSAGVSATWSPSFPSQKRKIFNNYDSRLSIHPEIQLQYYF